VSARGREWATTGSEGMGTPFSCSVLAELLARSYRTGWADGGLLLDHMREHGTSVLLLADATRTGGGWVCAWRTTAGAIVRKDAVPWLAVRAVAEAACKNEWEGEAEALAGLVVRPHPFALQP
jgi:hypothetical protein